MIAKEVEKALGNRIVWVYAGFTFRQVLTLLAASASCRTFFPDRPLRIVPFGSLALVITRPHVTKDEGSVCKPEL